MMFPNFHFISIRSNFKIPTNIHDKICQSFKPSKAKRIQSGSSCEEEILRIGPMFYLIAGYTNHINNNRAKTQQHVTAITMAMIIIIRSWLGGRRETTTDQSRPQVSSTPALRQINPFIRCFPFSVK